MLATEWKETCHSEQREPKYGLIIDKSIQVTCFLKIVYSIISTRKSYDKYVVYNDINKKCKLLGSKTFSC